MHKPGSEKSRLVESLYGMGATDAQVEELLRGLIDRKKILESAMADPQYKRIVDVAEPFITELTGLVQMGLQEFMRRHSLASVEAATEIRAEYRGQLVAWSYIVNCAASIKAVSEQIAALEKTEE